MVRSRRKPRKLNTVLYLFDDLPSLNDGFIQKSLPYLSEERRKKALSYYFPEDGQLSAVVYLLLRLALSENFGIDVPPIFNRGGDGKPFLPDYPHIHFNLSHCKSAAACVVSRLETGVDVQEIFPARDDLAKRVLTDEEYKNFRMSRCPNELFCKYWVIKESLMKKTGQGLSVDPSGLSAEGALGITLFKGADYYCCVSEAAVRLRRVHSCELI